MSRFDELCKAYAKARKNYFNYRESCLTFAENLINGLIKYLECPPEQVRFFPLDQQEPQPGHTYTLMGSMTLLEDTFWHFGMGLTLYESKHIYPHETVFFQFMIKAGDTEDSFFVKLEEEGEMFRIATPDDAILLYKLIFNEIEESYKNSLQHFLENTGDTARKIGFDSK